MATELIETGSDKTSVWGQLRADSPGELSDAMRAWKQDWLTYAPSIHRDPVDLTLAHWTRWKEMPL